MTRFPDRRFRRPAALAACLLLLGGCSVFEGRGSTAGSTLGNLLKYGSTTEPPIAAKPVVEAADCPSVLVLTGRSAVRQGNHQVSIANLARECIERENGAVVVKVGVEGLALVGAGGGTARFDVPVVFQVRIGDRVVVSRTRRASVSVAAGDTQASFVVVEGDMVVPPNSGPFDIEVGLGGAAASGASGRRRS